MYDVFFYEAFAEEEEALRKYLPPRYTAGFTARTIQESGDLVPPARLISVRTQSQLPLAWAPKLSAILSRSTGYDHLLAYAAQVKQPPALGYLPLYCHRAVAEQALLLWLALLRRLPQQVQQFREFHRDGLTGREAQARTLAVFGVGHIGYEVVRIASALGMHVLGVDLVQQHTDVVYVERQEALARADVIVCAMDLNSTNRNYFDAAAWQVVKPGAVFVNVSRGELSPSVALLSALDAGQLAGVALDVFNHESLLATSLRQGSASCDPEVQATLLLSERLDCLCTPHNAFNTEEAVERKSEHSVQQIIAFCEHGKFLWEVRRTWADGSG